MLNYRGSKAFINLTVIYDKKNNTGKNYLAHGKLRENTGNFILAGVWPPCQELQLLSYCILVIFLHNKKENVNLLRMTWPCLLIFFVDKNGKANYGSYSQWKLLMK